VRALLPQSRWSLRNSTALHAPKEGFSSELWGLPLSKWEAKMKRRRYDVDGVCVREHCRVSHGSLGWTNGVVDGVFVQSLTRLTRMDKRCG
jgi:hypothetical protein